MSSLLLLFYYSMSLTPYCKDNNKLYYMIYIFILSSDYNALSSVVLDGYFDK